MTMPLIAPVELVTFCAHGQDATQLPSRRVAKNMTRTIRVRAAPTCQFFRFLRRLHGSARSVARPEVRPDRQLILEKQRLQRS